MQQSGEMSEQIPAPPESQETPQINEVRLKAYYCSPSASKHLNYRSEMSLKPEETPACSSLSRRRRWITDLFSKGATLICLSMAGWNIFPFIRMYKKVVKKKRNKSEKWVILPIRPQTMFTVFKAQRWRVMIWRYGVIVVSAHTYSLTRNSDALAVVSCTAI